ncbi:MAG TPA: SPFH domain-containing protein [Geopsychrobacteraceae bacterium]|nr:SPFH domain-containing protein [Geopsychrobacteraceae bacterium]
MNDELHSSLLHRARLKSLFKRGVVTIMIIMVVYSAIALLYASKTIYKVRRNYAVIVETLSGERVAVTEVGWHVRPPLFTKLELEVPLMNQELHLGSSDQPQRIMSRGNVALWTSAMLTFRIDDLERWGIENRSPQTLLQNDFDGIVKDVMQSETINMLVSDRVRIKEDIYRTLKENPLNKNGPTLEEKYGIKVVSFILRDTRYGEKLAEASEEKKRRELIAEAENYAADLEASRTLKLYAAYSESINNLRNTLGLNNRDTPALFDFLNQQKWAAAYQKNQQGQNTFVLNNTSASVPITLPALVNSEHRNPDVTNPQDQKPDLRQPVRAEDRAN